MSRNQLPNRSDYQLSVFPLKLQLAISGYAKCCFLFLLCFSAASQASLTSQHMLDAYGDNEIEIESAYANQASYESLKNNNGCLDLEYEPNQPNSCQGQVYKVFSNIRELVHTANELTQQDCPVCAKGPTLFKLDGFTETELGFALRWTAAEEFSTQKDLTDSFIANALAGLESRVSAIRSGARGFTLVMTNHNDVDQYANLHPEIGYLNQATALGAGASEHNSNAWSRWGGFLNLSHTWGDKEASAREAAYDFDGFSINGGVDYRLSNYWVLGGTLAITQERIDFDSTQSIVDGEVEMNAVSINPFALFQSSEWFALTSLTYQYSDFDTKRDIKYGTGTVGAEPTNTSAHSSNKSDTYGINVSGGYYWIPPEYPFFAFEPYISAGYRYTKIEDYIEEDIQNDGFNFYIEEQSLNSLETSFGMKAQLTFTPNFGVLIPFIEAQWFKQHEDSPHTVEATYYEAGSLDPGSTFDIRINPPEDTYTIYTTGISSVLLGSKQSSIDGVSTGGIQAFFSYSIVKGIAFYNQQMVTLGARYEF